MSAMTIQKERCLERSLRQTEEVPICDESPVLERITPHELEALHAVLARYQDEIGPIEVPSVKIDWTGSQLIHAVPALPGMPELIFRW